MSIFRHGDCWRARVHLNGKAVASKTGFTTKALAKKWHDEQLAAFGDNRVAQPKRSFDELVEKYKADHLGKQSPGTQRRYLLEIEERISPFFRFVPVEGLTLDLLDTFRDKIGRECKPRQANYCLSLLSSILSRGVRWRWLRTGHTFEPFDVEAQNYEWWDDKVYITRFLQMAKAKSKFYRLYYLALASGMREGELVALWKTDIDFGSGRIFVQRKWDLAKKDYGLPKHGKTRYIDFDPKGELARILSEAVGVSRHKELVFPSRGGRPLSRGCFAEKVFKSLAARANVPVIAFHGLRHGFASWYMLQHDNIWALKEILGHSDIKTTQRYAHHSAKNRKAPLDLQTLGVHNPSTLADTIVVGL